MKTDFARQQMVEQQVRAWDVLSSDILLALMTVPREQFVPVGFEALAFADTEIPIGHGEFMMTPTLEGRLLQALDLKSTDSVLEIGTGTGFVTACLAQLAGEITSVDVYEDFLKAAAANLEDSGTRDIELLAMDATKELPDEQYDAIAVTGSVPAFDERYLDALKQGGRLFIIVGEPPVMDAQLIVCGEESARDTSYLFETIVAPLVNSASASTFRF